MKGRQSVAMLTPKIAFARASRRCDGHGRRCWFSCAVCGSVNAMEGVIGTLELEAADVHASGATGDVPTPLDEANTGGDVVISIPPTPPPSPQLLRLNARLANASHFAQLTGANASQQPAQPAFRHLVSERAASFHKKILKVSALNSSTGPQLKLGRLKKDEVAALIVLARFVVAVGPFLQIIWSVWIEPDKPEPSNRGAYHMTMGDMAEATIQLLIIVTACLFTRRIALYPKREGIQAAMATVLTFVGVIGGLTFASDLLKSTKAKNHEGRKLLSISNTILATVIYLTIGYLTDNFAETILSSKEAFNHAKQQRLLDRSRRLAFALYFLSALYFAFRMALTWRSELVFDFLPLTNFVTAIRLDIEDKVAVEDHLTLDTLAISVADVVLLSLSLTKCFFTHQLFDHIFLIDYARVYTAYRVFVVNFCTTITVITLSGLVAAWSVPFSHTIEPSQLELPSFSIGNTGSVYTQLGFRLSLALWFLSAAYYALPADTKGIRGWFVGSKEPLGQRSDRVKYFLYESDVHLKEKYRNLASAGDVDPHRFILENQVEAFNFAQLVYARGNARYDQDLEGLEKLIGDPSYSILEVIHDAQTDTHCLILASDAKIVVTFRGTSSKKNARTDLQSSMTVHAGAKEVDLIKAKVAGRPSESKPAQSGTRTFWHHLLCKKNEPRVHSGFYTAYQSVASTVLSLVRSVHSIDPRPILVTGHSLGGALAALCSFDIVRQLSITNVTCTTFGCPRIGNHAFQKRFMQVVPATFAIVNASDMITKLPPKTPKAQSYASVGTIVLVNSFGNLVIDPNVLELGMMHRGYSLKAHTMRAYHLSLLLWCLRAHQAKYQPKFWRQSLAFLQAEYGHLTDVREYLKQSAFTNTHLPRIRLSVAGSLSQSRQIVRRLEATLRQEQEDIEDEMISISIVSRIKRWLCLSQACEWFSTNDAIRLLKSQLDLESDAAAVDLGQTLTVQGLIKPETIVFSRNARFCFPILDEDDEENDEE